MAESAEMEGSQFSVSQQEQTAKGALLENATDIKVRHSLEIRIILFFKSWFFKSFVFPLLFWVKKISVEEWKNLCLVSRNHENVWKRYCYKLLFIISLF